MVKKVIYILIQPIKENKGAANVGNRTLTLKQGTVAADLINNSEIQEDLLNSKDHLPGEKDIKKH